MGPHLNLKNIGICFYPNVLKEEKKKHKYATYKTLKKTHIVQLTKYQLQHIISRQVNFWNTKNCMGSLNDPNMLQVDEMNNKASKVQKIFENVSCFFAIKLFAIKWLRRAQSIIQPLLQAAEVGRHLTATYRIS